MNKVWKSLIYELMYQSIILQKLHNFMEITLEMIMIMV